MRVWTIVFFTLITASFQSAAMHIIGGELYYSCLGNNNYQITLKVYRDCNSTTPFDDTAWVAVYDANGAFLQTLSIPFPGATYINPDLSDPCLQLPPGVCVEEAVYQTTVSLSSIPGGYNLTYQRCCRNNTMVNIYDPQNTGATFTAHIPDNSIAACNSSPHFINYPPIVICIDKPLVFDHSAVDPDSDSLVYSLCTPYQGGTFNNPKPNPPLPPPYNPIIWQPPYSLNNQIGGSPVMSIDPVTGLLTGSPQSLGQYVVGISVKEYRNGIYLGQDIRDFQFNITTCDPLILADFTAQTATEINDTLLICGSFAVDFSNESFGSNDYKWDFGVPGINSDTSTDHNPVYTYPDTGVYKVMLSAAPGLYCGDTIYKYVEIREGLDADFSFENKCALTPVQFTDQSVLLDGYVSDWQWNFGNGQTSNLSDPINVFNSGGTFNVTLLVHNNYGCFASIVKPVEVYPLPVINASPDTFICDIDSVTLHAEGGSSYLWSPDYNISDLFSSQPLVKPELTTVYTVTATTSDGCINTDSVTVMVTDTVTATISSDTTICEGESIQLFALNAVYYQWSPPDGLSNSYIADPIAIPEQTTIYIVTSFIGSCFDEDTITINVLQRPDVFAGDDVTINQGESVQLNTTGDGFYNWLPPDNLSDPSIYNPVATPLTTTTYAITVTSFNGCSASDTVVVNVTHIHLIIVPNAFTPNGDGMNDLFQFYTKGINKILSVKVFDRWGEIIFESKGDDTAWDGQYKNQLCEIGAYVYIISGVTFDGDVINEKGSVTLLR